MYPCKYNHNKPALMSVTTSLNSPNSRLQLATSRIILIKSYRECFAIRGDVPVMEAPPVNSKLLHELEVSFHWKKVQCISCWFQQICNFITPGPKSQDQIIIILLLLAMAREFVPSSQGQFSIGAPKGSPLVPRNICQNATLNRTLTCSTKQIYNPSAAHNVQVN